MKRNRKWNRKWNRKRTVAGKWRHTAALFLLLTGAAALGGCGGVPAEESFVVQEAETEDVSYLFGVAEIGDVEKTEKIKATYRQTAEQEVSFSLSGKRIEKVYVREGDSVKKGDLLAELSGGQEREIESLEYQIERNRLLLGYTDTNEEYAISAAWVNYLYNGWGTEESVKETVESIRQSYRYQREDYADAIELDQRKLDQLLQEQQDSKVYAALSGVVYEVAEGLEGSTSKADEVILTIVDTNGCLFETEAAEFAEYFKEGETVSLTISYGTAAGSYELMPMNRDEWNEKQYFFVYEGAYETGIEVGTGGTIRLVTDSRRQVLCVPVSAVNSADGRTYVYVLDRDGQREVRWVETGLYGDDTVEILSGLEEGEKVIRRW